MAEGEAQQLKIPVHQGNFTESSGYEIAHSIIASKDLPEAVFCANDQMALGFLRGMQESGLNAPRDMALIGFDDIPQAMIVYPKLTTVRQPLEQMGQVAVRMLLEIINDRSYPPQRATLPTQLVIRDSCGPCRTQSVDDRKTLKKSGGSLLQTE